MAQTAPDDQADGPETRADAEDQGGGGGSRRHRPLDTLERVRRELSRVYYEQKDGKLTMDLAKGRAYLLSQLVAVLKAEQSDDAELERRLAELERRIADAKPRTTPAH